MVTPTSQPPSTINPQSSISSDWKVEKKLGEGSFAIVALLTNTSNPMLKLAMKGAKLHKTNRKQFEYEFGLHHFLSKTPHDNVIKMFGAYLDQENCNLYLEYADDGDLFDKIKQKEYFDINQARMFFRQLLCGLAFIHDNNIVHRDIKPENMLLTKTNVLKISDFGLATTWRRDGKEEILTTWCGTTAYVAPEILMKQPYRGPPADIWSCGIVLITMLTGSLPWVDGASDKSYEYMQWMSEDLEEEPWDRMEVRVLELLRTILTNNVDARVTIPQIQTNEWLNEESKNMEKSNENKLKRTRGEDEIVQNQQSESETTSNIKRPCLDAMEPKNSNTSSPLLAPSRQDTPSEPSKAKCEIPDRTMTPSAHSSSSEKGQLTRMLENI